jgi:hypothetical protein
MIENEIPDFYLPDSINQFKEAFLNTDILKKIQKYFFIP